MIDNGPILIKNTSKNLSEAVAVPKGGTATSTPWKLIDLTSFALEYKVAATGTPNVKIEIEQSSDGENWYTPDNISDVVASATDKNQHGIQLTQAITVQHLRAKFTDTLNSVDDTVVTVNLSAQKRFPA